MCIRDRNYALRWARCCATSCDGFWLQETLKVAAGAVGRWTVWRWGLCLVTVVTTEPVARCLSVDDRRRPTDSNDWRATATVRYDRSSSQHLLLPLVRLETSERGRSTHWSLLDTPTTTSPAALGDCRDLLCATSGSASLLRRHSTASDTWCCAADLRTLLSSPEFLPSPSSPPYETTRQYTNRNVLKFDYYYKPSILVQTFHLGYLTFTVTAIKVSSLSLPLGDTMRVGIVSKNTASRMV